MKIIGAVIICREWDEILRSRSS